MVKKIGVDLDGVLGAHDDEIAKEAYRLFRVKFKPSDITQFKLEACTDLTEEQVKTIFDIDNTFKNMKPYKDARIALKKLFDAGYFIYIVTDRPLKFFDLTFNWLHNNNFVWHCLCLRKASDKSSFSRSNHIKIFIEDRLSTALELANICKKVFLIDKTYNQGETPKNVIRVKNWNQILENMEIE